MPGNSMTGTGGDPNATPGAVGCAKGTLEAPGGSKGAWTVKSILDVFCKGDAEDRAVVKKLPKLTIHRREVKQVHYKKYVGGKWVDGGFTSGGSARGNTVWVNKDTESSAAASTLFHEVVHTDQPSTMPKAQREYDAYTKQEEWNIKKGLPARNPSFRKTVNGKIVPDADNIKKFVDKAYAYNPPTPVGGGVAPPAVEGLTTDGKKVKLDDGTTRAPKEGDAYRLPDTGGKIIETIDPKKWKCP